MNKVLSWGLSLAAILILGLSFFHASWLADDPAGAPKLVAAKGVQPAVDTSGCVATVNMGANAIAVGHDVASLQGAAGAMADAVHVPAEVKRGALVIPPQFERKCEADKARAPSDASEVVAAVTKPELFWHVKGAAAANALLAKLPAGDKRHIVIGDSAAMKAVKSERPQARTFDTALARQCVSEYRLSGLWGSMPASCQGGAMLLTLDDLGLTLWGWPNRLIDRAAKANVTLIIAESVDGDTIKGLSDVNQYGDIANSYNGYIWVENISDLGPALRR